MHYTSWIKPDTKGYILYDYIYMIFWKSHNYGIKIRSVKEFPGGPVVRIRRFHCYSPGSIPGWETKVLQAVQPKKIRSVAHRGWGWWMWMITKRLHQGIFRVIELFYVLLWWLTYMLKPIKPYTTEWLLPMPVVLNWEWFCLSGDIYECLQIFFCSHTVEVGVTGI